MALIGGSWMSEDNCWNPDDFIPEEQKRAKDFLRQDLDAEKLRAGFLFFIEGLRQPDFDGRGAYNCARRIWQSPYLANMPDDCLLALAKILTCIDDGVHIHLAATLLCWFPQERINPIMEKVVSSLSLPHDSWNWFCVEFVKAMMGDGKGGEAMEHALLHEITDANSGKIRLSVIALTHHPTSGTATLFSKLKGLDIIQRWPSDYMRLDQRIFIVSTNAYSDISKVVERFYSGKRNGVSYILPDGKFLSEFGRYPGWDNARQIQVLAIAELTNRLNNIDLEIATDELLHEVGSYPVEHLYGQQPELKDVLISFFVNPELFREPY
jgi:hypothetical protein